MHSQIGVSSTVCVGPDIPGNSQAAQPHRPPVELKIDVVKSRCHDEEECSEGGAEAKLEAEPILTHNTDSERYLHRKCCIC